MGVTKIEIHKPKTKEQREIKVFLGFLFYEVNHPKKPPKKEPKWKISLMGKTLTLPLNSATYFTLYEALEKLYDDFE